MAKALFFLLLPSLIFGATTQYQRGPKDEASHMQELSRMWTDLRGCEADIAKLQNHISTQDEAIEDMRGELDREKKSEATSKAKKSVEEELASLKKHNEILTEAINSDKETIARLQATVQKQEDNLVYIQKALKSIMGAVGVKGADPTSDAYTVQSGDSLGEIAQKNNTSIEQLKKLNQLKSDKIFVGQKIRLP